jgi:hypothetical protein
MSRKSNNINSLQDVNRDFFLLGNVTPGPVPIRHR